jgi:hypothetical protein
VILQELLKLHKFYNENPILGMDIVIDEGNTNFKENAVKRVEDDIQIIQSEYNDLSTNVSSYKSYADEAEVKTRKYYIFI